MNVICASGQPGLGAFFYYLSLNLASRSASSDCMLDAKRGRIFTTTHNIISADGCIRVSAGACVNGRNWSYFSLSKKFLLERGSTEQRIIQSSNRIASRSVLATPFASCPFNDFERCGI